MNQKNKNKTYKAINFAEKLLLFSVTWSPKVIAEMNENQLKLAKLKGEFVWHKHDYTDEVFIVLHGALTILFRDGEVDLKTGEMFVVPQGVEHKPVAKKECHILLIEPKGVVNTGNVQNELTAQNDVWI